jgi:hypothetical protein
VSYFVLSSLVQLAFLHTFKGGGGGGGGEMGRFWVLGMGKIFMPKRTFDSRKLVLISLYKDVITQLINVYN